MGYSPAALPRRASKPMKTAVFSIVSPNYRHFARVLMTSVERHHPQWDRFVLMVGASEPPDREPFTTVPLDAIELPAPRRFSFRYTLLELNTAVKPWMFAYLFARGYDRVVYLDPDIVVYSPLAELDALPPETFLALTPHLTGFIGGDDHPSERAILVAGAYNLGFLAVSRHPSLSRFLQWWQEKLEYECVVEPARGLFVDQKWIDLAPGLFPDVVILRHEGYNVAYWNLGQRSVGADLAVNGQPLRFFHFSGFDPARPELVSKHHRGLKVADVPGVGALFDDYRVALLAAGSESFRDAPYAFATFADGTPISKAARIAYRQSEELQAAAGADPFARPELFRGLREPGRGVLAAKVGVWSYDVLSSARPLVRLFPRTMRMAMRERLLGRPESKAVRPTASGLNIAGYFQRDTEAGESARSCLRAAELIGIPTNAVDLDRADAPRERMYRTTIHHLHPGRLPSQLAASAYNIGCWQWELPAAWSSSASVDEVWAASTFVQSAISRKATVPVVPMPPAVEVTELEACSPEELGVPAGRFTFLCVFDSESVQRTNPFGAIEAFARAFPRDSSSVALLVVAASEPHERLRGIPNVYVTGRSLSRTQLRGLIATCGGVISLHRSESFGMVLAEAMALGKPVIATGWSGNMDFMNSGNSCPVGYELVPLDRRDDAYETGQQWAEPDVEQAAQLLRPVVEDEAWRTRIGERARETMRTQFSLHAAGLRYRRRLAFLGLLDPFG